MRILMSLLLCCSLLPCLPAAASANLPDASSLDGMYRVGEGKMVRLRAVDDRLYLDLSSRWSYTMRVVDVDHLQSTDGSLSVRIDRDANKIHISGTLPSGTRVGQGWPYMRGM